MTPAQVQLVETSFRLVVPIAEPAAAIFYERLFALDPALRGMFAGSDMHDQGRKLMTAIGFVVGHLRAPEKLLPVVADLGRRHAGYGVRARDYDTVGAALLATLAEGLGPNFTPEVGAAWAAAYALLAGVMQDAAAPARAA